MVLNASLHLLLWENNFKVLIFHYARAKQHLYNIANFREYKALLAQHARRTCLARNESEPVMPARDDIVSDGSFIVNGNFTLGKVLKFKLILTI